jgi:hypothetical protein
METPPLPPKSHLTLAATCLIVLLWTNPFKINNLEKPYSDKGFA